MSNEAHSNAGTARYITWMVVALVVVIADQLTKWAIIEWVALYDKIPVNSFINITHQKNPGAAWSFLADAGGWQRWFFIVLSTGVSALLVVWLWRIRNDGQTILAAGLTLVLGGAIGNLIDRILLGHVTDFIQVMFGSWAFPSFNVADASISVGAVLLIIDALFFSTEKGDSDLEEKGDSDPNS